LEDGTSVFNVEHLERVGRKEFEDYETLVVELKTALFKSLYAWIAAYNSPYFSSFYEFLDFCSFSS
jgi:hypothetical protein